MLVTLATIAHYLACVQLTLFWLFWRYQLKVLQTAHFIISPISPLHLPYLHGTPGKLHWQEVQHAYALFPLLSRGTEFKRMSYDFAGGQHLNKTRQFSEPVGQPAPLDNASKYTNTSWDTFSKTFFHTTQKHRFPVHTTDASDTSYTVRTAPVRS